MKKLWTPGFGHLGEKVDVMTACSHRMSGHSPADWGYQVMHDVVNIHVGHAVIRPHWQDLLHSQDMRTRNVTRTHALAEETPAGAKGKPVCHHLDDVMMLDRDGTQCRHALDCIGRGAACDVC